MTIDFNSRTHVECDIGLTTTERRLFISTHALTWSATCTESIFSRQSSGFQLTHSRGVRLHRIHFFPPIVRISTHALTWSATVCAKSKDLPRIISTHALTWSATLFRFAVPFLCVFQLTHSRGVRHFGYNSKCFRIGFQLTHSRGVRPCHLLHFVL